MIKKYTNSPVKRHFKFNKLVNITKNTMRHFENNKLNKYIYIYLFIYIYIYKKMITKS